MQREGRTSLTSLVEGGKTQFCTKDVSLNNYRGIITIIVRENLRLLCSKKSERSTRRVDDGAWGWGNMANEFTVHKVAAACVIGGCG